MTHHAYRNVRSIAHSNRVGSTSTLSLHRDDCAPPGRCREEFVRSIAHELNGLMLTISAGAGVAGSPGPADRQARGLSVIETAARQSRLMLRGLTRLMREQSDGEPRKIDLSAVVQEIAAVGRAFVPSATKLRVTTPSHEVWAQVDEQAVEDQLIKSIQTAAEGQGSEQIIEVTLLQQPNGKASIRVRAERPEKTTGTLAPRLPGNFVRSTQSGAPELVSHDSRADEDAHAS